LHVLGELGLIEEEGGEPSVPIIEVWNKWDLLSPEREADLREQMAARSDQIIVPVSAVTGQGCDDLLERAGQLLTSDARVCSFVIPASDGQRIAWLHAHGEVVGDEDGGAGEEGPQRRITVRLTPRELGRFSRL
jgi:GTP-binding protein HflX